MAITMKDNSKIIGLMASGDTIAKAETSHMKDTTKMEKGTDKVD